MGLLHALAHVPVVGGVGEQQVQAALLEDPKHLLQARLVVHPLDVPPVERQERAHLDLIVRVDEDEVLGEEDPHDVVAAVLVHGDAREALLVDLKESLEVQLGVLLQHEHLADLRVHVTHHLILVLEDAEEEVVVILGEPGLKLGVGILHVDGDEPLELVSGVGEAQVAPEQLVQDLADGPGDGEHHEHEDLHEPDGVRPHHEAMARAYGLGHDLAERHDKERRGHQTEHAARDVREQDGNKGVHDRVAQE
mmetsp:Transcript_32513/g.103529  ORF Transcript_32513/g.103529 Transcript_32513/m.103529 type:complete len:251 (+) Transcript_32513:1340-2092(+)